MERRTHNNEGLIQTLHGQSALLFLYQTRPDKYAQQIRDMQIGMAQTSTDLFSQHQEAEILPAIGPLILSSILPVLPKNSKLADYISLLTTLEQQTEMPTIQELVSSFDHIFVLLGKKASGKGTMSEIMTNNYGIAGMPTSDWLRGIAKARNFPEPFNPVMLRELGDELREEFGGDVMVWLTLQEFYLKGYKDIVFDGLRASIELKSLPKTSFIWVDAPDEKRLERVISRARPGDPTTIEQLLVVDQRSFPEADALKSQCGYTIVNTTDNPQILEQEVNSLMNYYSIHPIQGLIS